MKFAAAQDAHASQTLPKSGDKRANRTFLWVFLGTVFFLAGVAFPGVTLLLLNWQTDRQVQWVGALYQQKTRALALQRVEHRPTLISFGGSSGLFGFDAESIQRELKTPTVNFSTFAGLSVAYHLSWVKRTAQPSDTALLVFEPELFFSRSDLGTDVQRAVVWTVDKPYLRYLPPGKALAFIYGNPLDDYVRSCFQWYRALSGKTEDRVFDPNNDYGAFTLGPNGDMRGVHPAKQFVPFNPADLHGDTAIEKPIEAELADAVRWARQRSVRLLFAFPAMALPPEKDRPALAAAQRAISDAMARVGIPVVIEGKDTLYPPSFFIDTRYHPNNTGRRIYSVKLAGALRTALGNEKAVAPEGAAPRAVFVGSAATTAFPDCSPLDPARNVRWRFLAGAGEKSEHPDSISVGELKSQDLPVYFTDDTVRAAVEGAGLKWREVAGDRPSLADWVKRYDKHLFLLSLARQMRCPFPATGLPPAFKRFVAGDGFRVGVLGTGPYSAVESVRRGEHPVTLVKRKKESLPGGQFPGLRIVLKSASSVEYGELGEKTLPILVNGEQLSKASPGLAVTVIDPVLQIAVAQGTFTSERLPGWTLREVVP